MNFSKCSLQSFLSLAFLFLIYSCNEDDHHNACRPTSLKNQDDSTVFEYNDADKVASIIHYVPATSYLREERLEYDDNGRLKHVSFFANNGQLVKLYELIYDGNGNPQKMNTWGNDPSFEPTVTTFYHDSKDRLTKREFTNGFDITAGTYEYHSDGRVARFSYQNGSDPVVLGHENLSYDKRKRFFGWVPELDVLYIYIHGFDPGETNVLTSRIYAASPFYIYPEPHDVSHEVYYDRNGRVKNVVSLTEDGGWVYSDIKYESR